MSALLSRRVNGSAEMFSVREVPWHGEGRVIDTAPTTADEARDIALGREDENGNIIPGSAWEVVTAPDMQFKGLDADGNVSYDPTKQMVGGYFENPEHHRFVRSDSGFALHVAPKSTSPIPNKVVFDLAYAIGETDNKARFETGGALDDGRYVWALVQLDDPIQIEGDTTVTMPYAVVKSAHDGSSALVAEFTMVRVVCMNTWRASEMVASMYESRYTIKHTKNWEARLDEAKLAMLGLKKDLGAYKAMMDTLARITVTDEQWVDFERMLLPAPSAANASERVRNNVERDRSALQRVRESITTAPVAHTAYGMLQAAGEFFDYERKLQGKSYLRRTMLKKNDAKNTATNLVCEAVGIKGGAKGLRELAGLSS